MTQIIKSFFVEEVDTTVEVTAWFDKIHYGYDADGNRGEWRWVLDKTNYTIPDVKDNGERLTATEKLECEVELQNKLAKCNDWQLGE
jgi:hypothetical protein